MAGVVLPRTMTTDVAKRDARRRWWYRGVLALLVCGAYPAFVMIAVYSQWFAAHLPGGRNGPADAYRHSLASAVVAYTLSPRCVDWVTAVMERGGDGNPSRAMDAHNNRIGAQLGATASNWNDLRREVRAAVDHGAIDARSPDQITWLAPAAWQDRLY
jgi:hypothetical protein